MTKEERKIKIKRAMEKSRKDYERAMKLSHRDCERNRARKEYEIKMLADCVMTDETRYIVRQRKIEQLREQYEGTPRISKMPPRSVLENSIRHLYGTSDYYEMLERAQFDLECMGSPENKQSASYKAYEDLIEVIECFDYLFTMYDARIMYLLDEQLPKLCEQLPMEGR
jgi:hypothetical protein